MMAVQYPAPGQCDPTMCSAGFVATTACGAMGDFQACDPRCLRCARCRQPQTQGCH